MAQKLAKNWSNFWPKIDQNLIKFLTKNWPKIKSGFLVKKGAKKRVPRNGHDRLWYPFLTKKRVIKMTPKKSQSHPTLLAPKSAMAFGGALDQKRSGPWRKCPFLTKKRIWPKKPSRDDQSTKVLPETALGFLAKTQQNNFCLTNFLVFFSKMKKRPKILAKNKNVKRRGFFAPLPSKPRLSNKLKFIPAPTPGFWPKAKKGAERGWSTPKRGQNLPSSSPAFLKKSIKNGKF